MRRLITELDSGNRDIVDELCSPGYQLHFPGSPPLDLEALKGMVNTFYDAFPDLKHTIDELVAVDDKVVLRVTNRATHKGEFEGIAPTGKEVTIEAIAIMRIEDGRIAEEWEIFDMYGLMQQLGAIPK